MNQVHFIFKRGFILFVPFSSWFFQSTPVRFRFRSETVVCHRRPGRHYDRRPHPLLRPVSSVSFNLCSTLSSEPGQTRSSGLFLVQRVQRRPAERKRDGDTKHCLGTTRLRSFYIWCIYCKKGTCFKATKVQMCSNNYSYVKRSVFVPKKLTFGNVIMRRHFTFHVVGDFFAQMTREFPFWSAFTKMQGFPETQ